MEPSKIVFLWSHVRSVSTAFERAFMQREDYVSFHEPFGEPCYFGPERIYSYYDNELDAHSQYTHLTFSQIINEILEAADGPNRKKVFIKDMARHVVRPNRDLHPDAPTVLPIDFLKRCTHTFIIRTPEKSVPSLYRAYKMDGKDLIPEDIGYPEVLFLFEYLTKLTGERPAIVEATDLVTEPEKIMRLYCEKGIKDSFESDMLEWKPERIQAFDKWPGWHDVAQYSTGFSKTVPKKASSDELELPDDVKQLIEESMPIYEKLLEYKLAP